MIDQRAGLRSHECEIHIDNQGISRKHARIVQQDGRYWVEDLNSHNGTYIGNQRIQRHLLRDGEEILVGKHALQFMAMESVDPSAAREESPVPTPQVPAHQGIAGEDMDGTLMMKAPFGEERVVMHPALPGGGNRRVTGADRCYAHGETVARFSQPF